MKAFFTPYGTGLNLSIRQTWQLAEYAEIELNVLMGQYLDRRIDDIKIMWQEVNAWQTIITREL